MGSFNTTCIASGQTIAPGDRCYVLPIRLSKGYEKVAMTLKDKPFEVYGAANSTCYPHAFWEPIGDFIEGVYYDYGQVELVNNKYNSWRLFTFLKELWDDKLDVKQGENPIHDTPVNLVEFVEQELPLLQEAFTAPRGKTPEEPLTQEQQDALFKELTDAWHYVFEAAQERRLFTSHYNEPFPAQFAVIHGAAYENLIAMVEECKNWEDESLARRPHFDRAFAKLSEPMDDGLLQELAAAREKNDEKEVESLQRLQLMIQEDGFRDYFMRIGRMEGLQYVGYPSVIRRLIQECRNHSLTADQLFERARPFLDSQYVFAGMNMLNLRLKPMPYCSQDYENEIGGAFADFVQETSKTITQARRDRHGVDGNDDDDNDDDDDDAD